MDPLTLLIGVIILLILSTGSFIFFQEKQDSRPIEGKPATLKKQEIITGYQEEIEALLKSHEGDKKKCISEKTKTLHRINKELASNIFFDPDEIKTLLYDLARYEAR